jgi:hypothetical protein
MCGGRHSIGKNRGEQNDNSQVYAVYGAAAALTNKI